MTDEQMFAEITKRLLRYPAWAVVEWLQRPNGFFDGNTPLFEMTEGDPAHILTFLYLAEG